MKQKIKKNLDGESLTLIKIMFNLYIYSKYYEKLTGVKISQITKVPRIPLDFYTVATDNFDIMLFLLI